MPEQGEPAQGLIRIDNPPPTMVDEIFAVIRANNDTRIEVWRPERFGFFARDDQGQFLGGVYGTVARGWLYLDGIAVAETARHHGLGSRLLQAAEEEARRRGCHHIWLETYSFQARPFYERHGYTIFGTLHDYPIGYSRYFMQKALETGAPAHQ
ncbi:MAG TPA: GNAT family N-acetyltransferase [Roseiflexaceae bacterium]|nr:GNAT family N-acetyltransferase [Roseiflexaceae bacterium]